MSLCAIARRAVLALTCMSVASGFSQPAVIQTLFDQKPGHQVRGASSNRTFTLNTTATRALSDNPAGTVLLRQFPLANGGYAGFELEPAPVFAEGAAITVVAASGTTHSIALPEVQAWSGRETGGGSRTLILTKRSDGSLGAMVTGDPHTSDTVVMPEPNGAEYSIRSAEMPEREYCSVGDIVPSDFASQIGDSAFASEELQQVTRDTGTRQVELMLDVSHSTFLKLNSDHNRVTDYVTQLVAATSAIYRRDLNVQLVVSNMYVWSTPDPFNSDHNGNGRLDSGDQLDLYRNYLKQNRSAVDRDLAHLLNVNRSLGGIAYVNVLCFKDYAMGVSNIHGDLTFPADINSYYWDTMVFAHELGHNFGSPHTHCYPEPLDCCATQASCSGCTEAAPAAGTIMSYCHMQISRGGSVSMRFHDRVKTEIMARINASTCLTPYVAGTPRVEVAGETGKVIRAGDMTPDMTDGTDFSSTQVRSNFVTKFFIIGNPGSADLTLTNWVSLNGSRQFTIAPQPHVATLNPGGATYFGVTFDPSVEGRHETVVTVSSSDTATPLYQFKIAATAAQSSDKRIFMNTTAVQIPDGSAAGVTIEIPVSGISGGIHDLDFVFHGTNCNEPGSAGLEHGFVGDLRMVLESPTGTKVILMNSPGAGPFGSSGSNFCGTVLDDEAGAPSINDISPTGTGALAPPHTGVLSPYEPLSRFYGESANGVWKLHITDMQAPEGGFVRGISLEIKGSLTAVQASAENWQLYQ